MNKAILITVFIIIGIVFGIMALPNLKKEVRAKIISNTANYIYPEYGSCYKCDLPWPMVQSHDTKYTETFWMFPLCEKCWRELNTPENRMPYYRKLYNDWGGESPEHKWEDIEKAVNNEWH